MKRKLPVSFDIIKIAAIVLGATALSIAVSTGVFAALPTVWVVDGMQRVKPDAPAGTQRNIELFAARGEYEPFQIIIQSPQGGLYNVNVLVSDLTGPDSQDISKDHITLYREHYIYLSQGSSDLGESNRPLGKGWYPEPLIPFVDPQTGEDLSGAQLDAVPFDLAENKNQPIWVDVFVPRNTQSGKYMGTFTVTSQQGNVNVYLTLNVWDFQLPLKPSLAAVTQLSNAGGGKESYIELLKHKFMPYDVGINDERELIDAYGLSMLATPFWSERSYGDCDPMPSPPSLSSVKAEVERHQIDLELFAHYADEIQACPSIFDDAVNWAKRLREGGVKPMLPTSVVPELMGESHENSAADIWVVLPVVYDNDESNISQVLQRGEEVWSTNALIQDGYSPKWTIDFAPINFRIQPGFINQSLNLTGVEYWVFDDWTGDPWNDLTKNGDNVPGDGQFVYPGEQVGIKGVAPGMRLKWLREGSEDYEYIEILKSIGKESIALNIASQVGPDWRNWTRSTEELYSARKTLGEEIHQITSLQYTLAVNINPSGGGSVSKNPDKSTYSYGEQVELTAEANSGFAFSSWSGDFSGFTSPVTIIMDGNKSVLANFDQSDIVVTDSIAPVDDLKVPFDRVSEGNFSQAMVTVTNNGNANLVIGDIGGSDPLAGPFSIESDDCSGGTIMQGASCMLIVRFEPTTAGTFNDSFDIPYDDPDEEPVIVNVSGIGTQDTDGDGIQNGEDNCPNTPNSGQEDSDEDGTGNVCDNCPNDSNKTEPGTCGCGTPDTDIDYDGIPDCTDAFPDDPNESVDTDGGGGGGCFVSTVVFSPPTAPNVMVRMLVLGSCLIGFVRFRKKYNK